MTSGDCHAEDEQLELRKDDYPEAYAYLTELTGVAPPRGASGDLLTASAAVSVVLHVIKRVLGKDSGETHPLYIALRDALAGPRLTADTAKGVVTFYGDVVSPPFECPPL